MTFVSEGDDLTLSGDAEGEQTEARTAKIITSPVRRVIYCSIVWRQTGRSSWVGEDVVGWITGGMVVFCVAFDAVIPPVLSSVPAPSPSSPPPSPPSSPFPPGLCRDATPLSATSAPRTVPAAKSASARARRVLYSQCTSGQRCTMGRSYAFTQETTLHSCNYMNGMLISRLTATVPSPVTCFFRFHWSYTYYTPPHLFPITPPPTILAHFHVIVNIGSLYLCGLGTTREITATVLVQMFVYNLRVCCDTGLLSK